MQRPTPRLAEPRLLHPMLFWGAAMFVHGLLLGSWLFVYLVEGELPHELAVIGVLVLVLLTVLGLIAAISASPVRRARRR